MSRVNKNYFNLEYPLDFHCSVVSYMRGHSLLLIECQNMEKRHFLIFETTIFFHGPFQWKGADFQVAPLNKSFRFFDELNSVQQVKDRLKHFYLDGSQQTSIIAENANYSATLPPNFKTTSRF